MKDVFETPDPSRQPDHFRRKELADMQMHDCVAPRAPQQPEEQPPYDRGMGKLKAFQTSDQNTILNTDTSSGTNARGDNLNLLTGRCQLRHEVLNSHLLATKMRRVIRGDMNYASSFHGVSTHSSSACQCAPSQIPAPLRPLPGFPSTVPHHGLQARKLWHWPA